MRPSLVRGLLLGLVATASCLGFEPAKDMQSFEKGAAERAPGLWHGQWVLRRDPPALRTLGGSRALDIEVWHALDGPSARVHWSAGPAIGLPLPGAGRGAAINAKGGIAFALEAERRAP